MEINLKKNCIYIYLIFFISCCQQKTTYYKSSSGDKKIKYLYSEEIFSKKRCGKFFWFSYEGDTVEIANYKNGLLDGPVTHFYENGKIESVIYCKKNMRDGLTIKYYDNGSVRAECIYRNNKLWSVNKYYDSIGHILNLGDFTEGNGSVNIYYPNGKIKYMGFFKDGFRDSLWMSYTDNGILFDTIIYKGGIRLDSDGPESDF